MLGRPTLMRLIHVYDVSANTDMSGPTCTPTTGRPHAWQSIAKHRTAHLTAPGRAFVGCHRTLPWMWRSTDTASAESQHWLGLFEIVTFYSMAFDFRYQLSHKRRLVFSFYVYILESIIEKNHSVICPHRGFWVTDHTYP